MEYRGAAPCYTKRSLKHQRIRGALEVEDVGAGLLVVVIGAGQAGLSAAHHLVRRGLRPFRDFVVLDANDGPGGAWRHRWDSLTFDAAHGLHPLPGAPLAAPDPKEAAAAVVTRYYGAYEDEFELPVIRPVKVESVIPGERGFTVTAADGRSWSTAAVINSTGTWDKPHWPAYPGRGSFTGKQLHTHDFRSPADFAGRRVLVVGGGTSAVQFLLQLAAHGIDTVWSTRREPDWRRAPFDRAWGVDVEALVNSRTRAGLPPSSVVAATGLPLNDTYAAGIAAGTLRSRGQIASLGADSVSFSDGSSEHIDVILWATGFRAALDHLAPLRLREPGGGILVADDGVSVTRVPGLFLVGYGASASTIGATRAGRRAALGALAAAGETVPA